MNTRLTVAALTVLAGLAASCAADPAPTPTPTVALASKATPVPLATPTSTPVPAPNTPPPPATSTACKTGATGRAVFPVPGQRSYDYPTLVLESLSPQSEVALVPAFPSLDFNGEIRIIDLVPRGSLYYGIERAGRIVVFDNDPAVEQWSIFLDLRATVLSDFIEDGLLGLAFEPDSDRFYIYYRAWIEDQQYAVLSRFTMSADGLLAEAESVEHLLLIERPFGGHNGGQLRFGADGYLYLGLGDGGGPGADLLGNADNLATLPGSIIRIDVSGKTGYSIPPDNPFLETPGACQEIFAYGFRNPWRFSFDRATGDLWVGDVGLASYEEIDLVQPGGFYGWSVAEGPACSPYRGALPDPVPTIPADCDLSGITQPVVAHAYKPQLPAPAISAIIGGYVYRGAAIPALEGWYVYADFGGDLFAMRFDGLRAVEAKVIHPRISQISSMVQDADGDLLIIYSHPNAALRQDGVYRIRTIPEVVSTVDFSSTLERAEIVDSEFIVLDQINEFIYPGDRGKVGRALFGLSLPSGPPVSDLSLTIWVLGESGYAEIRVGADPGSLSTAARIDGEKTGPSARKQITISLDGIEIEEGTVFVEITMFTPSDAAQPFDTRIELIEMFR